jgi:hypothetical protein
VVLRDSPVIVLENVPIPEPSVVLVVSETVGPVVVLHTTPRAVTGLPPSSVILPPEAAVVVVMEEAVVVARVGRSTTARFNVAVEAP